MRTNRTARPAARHARPTRRHPLAAMLVAATAVAAIAILVTVAVVALACYLAGTSSATALRGGHSSQASTVSTSPLIDPTAGRGADSATCRHAPRSPRCMREGGTAAVVRDHGVARPADGGDDQTVLLGGEDVRPAEVPGRVPGRGGWVSELGPSRA
ncbi:hypothetical protein [Actinomyces oris]|uniref:hypothetical protein n=1 Tax=Actinomyces oris TaxID=544580 RepID=UPI00288ABAB0|nr:hypothetical protein [Actinomyces oris]